MNRDEVTETVKALINSSLIEPVLIKMEHNLKELGLDSIGFVELGTGLEQKFRIDIADEDLERCETVQQVVEAVMTSPTY